MKALICALSFLFIVPSAHGFDLFPEFHGLTEDEPAGRDPTRLIDSEYQSDVITYLLPLSWEHAFFEGDRAFDFTVGSLSGVQFLLHSRLRIRQPLSPGLEFRLTYFEQRDLDVQQQRVMLELVRWLNPKLGFSIYGQPSFYKRQNDLGLAFLFRPSPDHEIRLFHTWTDITRNAHNDQADFFADGRAPRSIGVVGRLLPPSSESLQYLEYYFRRETPTEWRFGETYRYDYHQWATGLKARGTMSEASSAWNLRLQASNKYESFTGLQGLPPSGVGQLEGRVYEVLSSYESTDFDFLGWRAQIEPGLGWFQRQWQDEASQKLVQRNLLPFFWIKIPGAQSRGSSSNQVALGYEVTIFKGDGEPPLAFEALKANATEHRLNFRYEIPFENGAVLNFALTADPDAAARGEGGLFEGGNGQFRTSF